MEIGIQLKGMKHFILSPDFNFICCTYVNLNACLIPFTLFKLLKIHIAYAFVIHQVTKSQTNKQKNQTNQKEMVNPGIFCIDNFSGAQTG